MMKFVIPSNAEDAASAACWLLGTGHEMGQAGGVGKGSSEEIHLEFPAVIHVSVHSDLFIYRETYNCPGHG